MPTTVGRDETSIGASTVPFGLGVEVMAGGAKQKIRFPCAPLEVNFGPKITID